MSIIKELEAKKLDIASGDPGYDVGYETAIDDAIEIVTKHTAPQITEAGIVAVRISENVRPELSAAEHALFVAGFQECIKWIGYTAPQPNWDAIDDLVKVYANDTATSDKHYDGILNYWRKLIGYTLDANGKAVAIQKGGEDDIR